MMIDLFHFFKHEYFRWCGYIKEAVERYHKQYSYESASKSSRVQPSLVSSSSAASASFGDITDSLPRQVQPYCLHEQIEQFVS